MWRYPYILNTSPTAACLGWFLILLQRACNIKKIIKDICARLVISQRCISRRGLAAWKSKYILNEGSLLDLILPVLLPRPGCSSSCVCSSDAQTPLSRITCRFLDAPPPSQALHRNRTAVSPPPSLTRSPCWVKSTGDLFRSGRIGHKTQKWSVMKEEVSTPRCLEPAHTLSQAGPHEKYQVHQETEMKRGERDLEPV